MIERYSIDEIQAIWKPQARFEAMFKVELALMEAQEGNLIPIKTADCFKNIIIDPKRISEIELETRHDVIAFCSSITEQVDPEIGKFFHFGVTSSDILDTATSLQIRQSLEIFLKDLQVLIKELGKKIDETQALVCMGQSHGMDAEPMIFGQKFLSYQKELQRRQGEYKQFIQKNLTAQFSGAVGNYLILSPEIEEKAGQLLNLPVESVSTQILPRDHYAKLFSLGALLACGLERMAIEIRHLHRSDVAEVSESTSATQKGSSAMPHKKNPISSENISGLCRVLRSHINIGMENCLLWHERDISHSSAERLIFPDHFNLLSYTTRRMSSTIKNLELHPHAIRSKLTQNQSYLSGQYLHHLIPKVQRSREDLYKIIKNCVSQHSDRDKQIESLTEELGLKEGVLDTSMFEEQTLKNRLTENFQKILKRT